MQSKKIYIADSYSLNTGDVGILLATVNEIEKKMPDAKIYIESSHPDTLRAYGIGHEIFPRIYDISGFVGVDTSKSRLIGQHLLGLYDSAAFFLDALLRRVRLSAVWLVRPSRRKQARAITEIDMWLSSGGGYLSSYYRPEFRFYGYLLARLHRKKFAIFAQSVGPFFGRAHEALARYFLNRADFITIREPDSFEYIEQLGIKKTPILTADIALLMPASKWKSSVGKRLAVCVKKSDNTYVEALAGVAKKLKSKGYEVIFVSQTPNDDTTAYELSELCAPSEVVAFGADPREIKALYGSCEYIIASRMHAIIFASALGVRWIGIGYEPKFKGLAQQLDALGLLIDEKQLTQDAVEVLIDKSARLNLIRAKKQVGELMAEAEINISVLREALYN